MGICRLFLLALVFALLPVVHASAYVGPGAGLGAIGALIAIVGAVLVAIFGVIFLPITMIRKKRKKQAAEIEAEKLPESAGDG